MKYILLINYFIIYSTLLTTAQQFKRPNLDFGGSKIDWKYTVEDSTEVQESNNLPFKRSETGVLWNAPIEINKKIIYNVDNANPFSFGNIISCNDLKTGEQDWIRYINPASEDGYFYNFYHSMVRGKNNELILTGVRSLVKSSLSTNQPNFGGRYIRKTIDLDNGRDKETYLNDRILVYKIGDINPDLSGGKELYYNQVGAPPASSFSDRFYPYFIDIQNDTAINMDGIDTTGQITFDTRNNGGMQNSIRIDGPFTDKNNEYAYLFQYERNGVAYQILYIVNKDAKILYIKDISESLRGVSNREHYVHAEQKGNNIYLTMKKNDNTPQGNRGYVILDMKGNILRKNTGIIIEGKKVGHIVTIPLKNSTDLMQIIRFQNNNDIFVYQETIEKSYKLAAHLKNKNSSAYAYIPFYSLQTSDDGIIISGSFLLDTVTQFFGVCRFDCGGWPVIMKLSAETLSIPTSTSESIHQNIIFSITPNPSSHQVTVTMPDIQRPVTLHITDQMGRAVLVQDMYGSETSVDLSGIASGMYFVALQEGSSGKQIGVVKKLVKVE